MAHSGLISAIDYISLFMLLPGLLLNFGLIIFNIRKSLLGSFLFICFVQFELCTYNYFKKLILYY